MKHGGLVAGVKRGEIERPERVIFFYITRVMVSTLRKYLAIRRFSSGVFFFFFNLF